MTRFVAATRVGRPEPGRMQNTKELADRSWVRPTRKALADTALTSLGANTNRVDNTPRAPRRCGSLVALLGSGRSALLQIHRETSAGRARRIAILQKSPPFGFRMALTFKPRRHLYVAAEKVSGTVIDFLSDWAPPRQHVDDPSVEEAHSAASAEHNSMSRTPGKSARPATGTRVDVPTTRPRQQDTKQWYLTDTFSL
jgi:hypothetical protein